MTDDLAVETDEVPPIRVVLDGVRWVIDYGGGITRRLASREEAVALARTAAAAERRMLDVAA
jgi:hypothetical protein